MPNAAQAEAPAAPPAPAADAKDEHAAQQLGTPGSDQPETAADSAGAEPQAAPRTAHELHPELLDPSRARTAAPERYTVLFQTTRGELHLDVRRSWAPHAADRLYNLVRIGYFDDTAFHRVLAGFVAQAGISGDPLVNRAWRGQRIEADPVAQSNVRGMVSFAASGKTGRTTQFIIDLADNPRLDAAGFAPLGRIRELDVAQRLYAGYGEPAPGGHGPILARMEHEGNAYLRAAFPKLDYIQQATISDEKRVP